MPETATSATTDAPDATTPAAATETMPPAAVAVEHLSHKYPPMRRRRSRRRRTTRQATPASSTSDRPALDDVSFEIAPGEIFGILGPNGGGKTTLFNILATMLLPRPAASAPDANDHASRLRVFGHDVLDNPAAVRRQLGVVFQHPSLDGKLTARENLVHQGRLYGLSGADLRQRIDHWLERFELADRRDDAVDSFSGGMRRRLEIAKALLHEPRLLLMDEPATGLDPGARREVWRHLPELRSRQGITVALTTHLMDEAEHCDRLAILAGGALVAADTPANLKARIGGDVITLTPPPGLDAGQLQQLAEQIADRFGPWPEQTRPRVVDSVIRFQKTADDNLVPALRDAWPDRIRSVTVGQPTLEDVFLHLTGYAFWGGVGIRE